MYWTTREGKQIPYSELTESHIQNIVNLFIKVAEKNKTIPESISSKFHDIMDEAERRNIDVGYYRHCPHDIGTIGNEYARFPSFSIRVGLNKSSTYSEFIDEIVVLKDIIQGDVSQFHQSDNFVYLPVCYKDAIDICIEKWEFECESWEDDFPHHGLGFD
jgi:hypothetical protein